MPSMLRIIEGPAQRATLTAAERQDVYGRMVEFGQALRSEGIPK